MRLIDADKLTKQIAGMAFANNYPANKALALCKLIDTQPTAYDVDRVVEQLKEVHEKFCKSVACGGKSMCKDCEEYIIFNKNIDIVKAGGKDE